MKLVLKRPSHHVFAFLFVVLLGPGLDLRRRLDLLWSRLEPATAACQCGYSSSLRVAGSGVAHTKSRIMTETKHEDSMYSCSTLHPASALSPALK